MKFDQNIVEEIVATTLRVRGYDFDLARKVAPRMARRAIFMAKSEEAIIDYLDKEITAFESMVVPMGGLQ